MRRADGAAEPPPLEAAWCAFAAGDAGGARRLAQAAREADPEAAAPVAALGFFLLDAGAPDAAAELLAGAASRWPEHAPAHWYLGWALQRLGDLPAAVAALRRACQLDPALDEAAFSLAWGLHDLGELGEARRWSAHALAAQRSAQRLLQRGWLHQEQGEHALACALYREALALPAPETGLAARLHLHLGQCLSHQGRPFEGIAALQAGLRLAADDAGLLGELGWQLRAMSRAQQALAAARRLTAAHPQGARGWHLLGVLLEDVGDAEGADAAYEKAQALDLQLAEPLARRARIRFAWGHAEGATWLADLALHAEPGHGGARQLLVQLALDRGDTAGARRLLLPLVREDRTSSEGWRLLGGVAAARGRPAAAMRWLQRALRQDGGNVEALRSLGWLHAEAGDLAAATARIDRLLQLVPDDVAAQVQGALVFARSGRLERAEALAERALAHSPRTADAWRALSEVRYRQHRWGEAEWAVEQALARLPGRADYWRHWAWVHIAQGRPGMARLALERARQHAGGEIGIVLELAEAALRAGDAHAALRQVDAVLAKRPRWDLARTLRARILTEGGEDAPGDLDGALGQWLALIWADPRHAGAVQGALRLLALGHGAAAEVLAPVRPQLRDAVLRETFAAAVHVHGALALQRLAAWARRLQPEDPWLESAALFAASMAAASTPEALARRARDWARGLSLRTGARFFAARPWPAIQPRRPRIAYIASQPHQRLLEGVLAAHAEGDVEVFVFTDQPLRALPPNVHLRPLAAQQLAEACAANSIEVAIDTGGLHPLGSLQAHGGQFGVLQAFAGGLAPVQAAWLGTWGSAGGLFDVLLADAVSVPPGSDHRHEEAVVRLEGGQWAWEAPAVAPEVAALPAIAGGNVTLGVIARHVRINDATLAAIARVAAALPDAIVRFIGTLADDWAARRDMLAMFKAHGVAAWRVRFEPGRGHAEFLRWFDEIDLVLDTFPGSGGLSTLDALWMGVPFVTLAGAWSGARQGASILAAIGRSEWVADDADGYVAAAIALASDKPALARERAGLRERMRTSPLLDARRLARQIEGFAKSVQPHAQAVLGAAGPKDRARMRAAWEIDRWLAKPGAAVDLRCCPPGAQPVFTVVVVLFNQAGLTRRCLQALADQQDVHFETVLVDNASTDRTAELLARVRGAHVLRNTGNQGFLRAANQGAQVARGRYLLFLNSDAILQAGALAAARAALDADPAIGALGARVVLSAGGLQEVGNAIFRDGSTRGIGRGEDAFGPAARVACSTDFCSGVFLATPLALWRLLGGFDDAYAPAYYEDTDYGLRVWKAGFRVVVEPRVVVGHLEWGSAAGGEAEARMAANRAIFRERHADFLAGQPAPAPVTLDGDRWASPEDAPRRPRVLYIEDRVPHMALGAGYPRARLMLRELRDWPVTLYPLVVPEDDWAAIHASVPASTEVALGHGLDGLEAFLERRRGVYDVLLVSRPPNLRDIRPLMLRRPDLFGGLRILYDAEALFATREIAQAAVRGEPMPRAAARERIASELRLAGVADEVLVVSERDARQYRAAGHRAHVLAHPIAARQDAPGVAGRSGLLFIGAVHAGSPNEDGLLWWIREVLPRLDALHPGWGALDVVGLCRSERVVRLAGPQVRIRGTQADLQPHYDAARVFVAPVRFAGGVPAKVIEAAANGLPAVASAILVRQLGWQDGRDVLAARDADAFARAVAALLRDDARWARLQQGALEQCRLRYDPDVFGHTLRALLRGG